MNFLRLSEQIPDEASSVRFLQQRGIIHAQRFCDNGHKMTLSLGVKDRWRCFFGECRQDKGLRTNNWLIGSRLPLRKVILFIYCWSRKMTSVEFSKDELEIGQNAVVDWNNYLREVCAWRLEQTNMVIRGPNTTVEIDESLFSRRKNHAGRVLPQQWVLGGICRETGECFMETVPDRSAATLLPIIIRRVLLGTTIVTDEWRAYRALAANGFPHLTVNHKYSFVDPVSGAHTQTIERAWRGPKDENRKRQGTNRAFVDSYLCEHMWRSRLNGRDPFDAILDDIAAFWPPNN